MSRIRLALTVLIAVGVGTSCYAAETNNGLSALTAEQLGGYSLKLDTQQPHTVSPPGAPDLRNPARDTYKPFIGLTLSRPLPKDFWDFAR